MRRTIVLCLTLAALVAATPARAEGELIGSSLSIFGDQGIIVGDQVSVSGTLFVDSTCPGNQTVDLWRTLPGEEPELLSTRDVTVNCDTLSGPYDYVDMPPVVGEIVYQATWAGTDLHAPAQSDLHVITVAKDGASLSLTGDRQIEIGESTTLSAKLRGPDDGNVSFYRVGPDGEVFLTKKSVNPSGTASITVSPKARTRYVARYGSSPEHVAASDSLIVRVRVITTAKMVHYSYKGDGYAVYDCCRAYYWFKVAPNHAGEQVTVQLQIFFEGKWRSYDPWQFKLRSTSTMEIFIDIDGGSGYRLRVKTCMPSHADHLGDCSPYAYFRYS